MKALAFIFINSCLEIWSTVAPANLENMRKCSFLCEENNKLSCLGFHICKTAKETLQETIKKRELQRT